MVIKGGGGAAVKTKTKIKNELDESFDIFQNL